jgi:FtsP/CotA-like multicopper oxidase with cupredoxin domain
MRHSQTSTMPNRRSFLKSSAGVCGVVMAGTPWKPALAATPILAIASRTIEVNKKAATVFSVLGSNGKPGMVAREGDRFSGDLLNASGEPLQMHWHGQVKAPANQDRARPDGGALAIGKTDAHDFELTPGTHWMHSHSLSEQQLLAAPMVAIEKDAGGVQDVVVMLHDFAFRPPQDILAELGGGGAHSGHGAGGGMMGKMMKGGMMGMTHANDVKYDAFLANDRTLDDPDVVTVEKGSGVRLRIINGGTATAFFISTPGLKSSCIAADGSSCLPISQAAYPLAQGQRIDLMVDIPRQGGAFPVLAQVEGDRFVTGIVLATAGAPIGKLLAAADTPQGLTDLAFETQLRAASPMAEKPADTSFMVMLGEEPGYRWTINGRAHGEHQPFDVRQGERVEMTFMNPTTMMHPMHLHGHRFQVVAIGGRRFPGALRDTVIVPAHNPVTVAFDANQKGAWFLHCHHLYHMASGMMTEVRIT